MEESEYIERIWRLERENTALKRAIKVFCEDCAVVSLNKRKHGKKHCSESTCSLLNFCPYK